MGGRKIQKALASLECLVPEKKLQNYQSCEEEGEDMYYLLEELGGGVGKAWKLHLTELKWNTNVEAKGKLAVLLGMALFPARIERLLMILDILIK